MRYYLIAGEASGDLHGSNLIKGLRAEDPDASFRIWGGDLMMEAAGDRGELVGHYKSASVMGLTDVIASLGKIFSNMARCRRDILRSRPDVVILIDYPGFNMKIAKFCHEHHQKVFYYIVPKTWASREGRNEKLKAWVDKLFIVFPFEVPYFTERGIPFIYKGNPLVDAIDSCTPERPVEGRYIAILAGSRKGEIKYMMPKCMEVVDALCALERYRDCKFVIAGAPARSSSDYEKYISGRANVKLVFGNTYGVLKFADAAIINSGTASLEAALLGTPQVVCWSASLLTALAAKYVLRVFEHIKFVSLGNLCLNRLAFKELLQYDFTVDNVVAEVRQLVENGEYRAKMLADYAEIREVLGGGGASRAVAKAMMEEITA